MNRPRINWFSPLPPTRSDIARQTLTLLPELAARAEVTVWCNDLVYDPSAAEHAAIKRYDPARPPWHEINCADATFYQMGNDPHYHEDIWRISRQHPGVVILHDLKLQHFFAGLLTENKTLSRRDYLELVEEHHSATGRARAELFLGGGIGIDELAEECPLANAAVDSALAAVVHSEAAQAVLSAASSLPVACLRLPAARQPPVDDSFIQNRDWNRRPYRLLVFGFLGSNRHVPSILRALAQFAERDQFRLDIYGTIDGAEAIVELACRLGLSEIVTWHGFASENELIRALEQSHLAINLRRPSMGEASGSQLHVWQYALAALVSDTGWYAALPRDAAAFVRPEHEVEDIQSHLAAFLADPQRYRAMGLSGRRYVDEHCTTRGYADGIMKVVARAPEFQAIWIARDLARRSGRAMHRWWAPIEESNPALNIASAIADLVEGDFRPKQQAA